MRRDALWDITQNYYVIVPFALNWHHMLAQGIALGTASQRIGVF